MNLPLKKPVTKTAMRRVDAPPLLSVAWRLGRARRIKANIAAYPGKSICYPVEANNDLR